MEFKPALVVNGEQATFGSAGWGIHPRTAIGQAEDGSIIMIVIDGRQPGYSIGITVGELAEMCLKYGAVQALNLDGGSSSIMYYNGRKITQPSGGDREKMAVTCRTRSSFTQTGKQRTASSVRNKAAL